MAERIPQSTSYLLVFKAFLTATGAEATGKTVAVTISVNGATSFSNPNVGALNATEMASGWYKVTLDTTDTGTLGPLAVRGTASGVDDIGVLLTVVSATTAGATNLDAAISSRMATYTQPTGFLAATFPGGTIANTTNLTAGTIATVTNQLTAAAIATGVWQDATAGDFTTASSIGKSLYTGNVVPGGTNGLFIAGTNAATTITTGLTTTFTGNLTGSVASVSGAVGSVTGLTAANLDATVSSRMATYAQPTGFLAAIFPATVASTTNITAGTITTATNLTNAATAGDLTTAMISSVTAAATAATPTAAAVTGAVGSVTGNVGGNVVGSVASVTAGVTLAASAVQAIWDALTAALTTAGSIGKLLVDNINATISSRLASASYTAAPTANQNADALLDRADAVETGLTPRQAMRLSAAADAGKLSGAATTTNTIRNAVADSKDRITATVDADGNRTAITYDLT